MTNKEKAQIEHIASCVRKLADAQTIANDARLADDIAGITGNKLEIDTCWAARVEAHYNVGVATSMLSFAFLAVGINL